MVAVAAAVPPPLLPPTAAAAAAARNESPRSESVYHKFPCDEFPPDNE